jgi:hypothetical protein
MKFKIYFLFVTLFCWSCAGSNLTTETVEEQVKNYCQFYIENVAQDLLMESESEVQITSLKKDSIFQRFMGALGNLLSPPSANIDTAFICKFEIKTENENQPGQVTLLLIKDKDHALYSVWENIQVVDIGEADTTTGVYYIVPKYLIIDGKKIWLKNHKK